MTAIEELREKLRDTDRRILELVKERNETAKRIGELKHKENLPMQNFEVEKAVLEHAYAEARRLGLHEETARTITRALIESALRVQEKDEVQRNQRTGHSALIVGGAGLMGAWFAHFLTELGYDVFVDDPKPSPYPKGTATERAYDLILLATPPSTLPGLVDDIGTRLTTSTLLADIGSVKGEAASRLSLLAKRGKKVASLHPMFGPRTDLLMGKNVLILDAGNSLATAEATKLFTNTTARTLQLPLVDHDALMAEILSLSHATSLVFNHALAAGSHRFVELESYASTTFRKQVEVSREVAQENPALYYEIQAFNPHAAEVLKRLKESAGLLRQVVSKRDEAAFRQFMEVGQRYYGGAP